MRDTRKASRGTGTAHYGQGNRPAGEPKYSGGGSIWGDQGEHGLLEIPELWLPKYIGGDHAFSHGT